MKKQNEIKKQIKKDYEAMRILSKKIILALSENKGA